jgi:hypothetical protein
MSRTMLSRSTLLMRSSKWVVKQCARDLGESVRNKQSGGYGL